MSKTNAVRIIESKGIPFTLSSYEVNEDDLSGTYVAGKIGADPDSVFKTLVASDDKNNIFVFCIPVTAELNLKKAAQSCGSKRIEMIKVKDLLSLTGYQRGGCSPVGMKKKYPVFFDETLILHEYAYVSAGVRGVQMKISPNDLLSVTDASLADLV